MVGHSRTCGIRLGLVILTIAAWCAIARAEEPYRLSRSADAPNDNIVVSSGSAANWQDSGQLALLLNGKVSIQFGTLAITGPRAVCWTTAPGSTPGGDITRLECYLENAVIRDGDNSQTVKSAFVDLTTRGQLKLSLPKGSKGSASAPENDPLVQRGRQLRPAQSPLPASIAAGQLPTVPVPKNDAVKPAEGPALARPQLPAPQEAPEVDPAVRTASFLDTPGTPVQLAPPSAGPVPPQPGQPVPGGGVPLVPGPGAPAPGGATLAPPEPLPPPTPLPAAPGQPPVPGAPGAPIHFRYFTISPRYNLPFQGEIVPLPDGRDAVVLTGGIIVAVHGVDQFGTLDMEADRVVVWTHGGLGQQMLAGIQSNAGQNLQDLEFYLAGHVEIREQTVKAVPGNPTPQPEQRTIRACEMYYDANRHVALGFNAELELMTPAFLQPLQMRAERLEQLSPTIFHGLNADISASRLPSDPGLRIHVVDATVEEREKVRRGLLGPVIDRVTGKPETTEELLTTSRDVMFYAEDVPFFYLPYLKGDARNPLGPIQNFTIGYDKIFGFQVGLTLNTYTLLGIDPLVDTTWRTDLDYLSKRGPTIGTEFQWDTKSTWLGSKVEQKGDFHAWYINDKSPDVLGGTRPGDPGELDHPSNRGYVQFYDNFWGLPYGFSFQTQLFYLSDKNLYEQYNKQDFDTGNQETFAYLKQQQNNWAWTLLAEPNLRDFYPDWATETAWLPRADAHLIGQSFDASPLNLFTFSVNAQAGYAQLQANGAPSPILFPNFNTIQNNDTGRFDVNGQLSMPLNLGDLKVVPYANLDLTYYTNDLDDNSQGRVIGGGGVRSSLPFSRLYPDVRSELFNLDGLYHKIVFSSNFYAAQSDVSHNQLPQLDLLYDTTEQKSWQDISQFQTTYNPAHATLLTTSPIYDPQLYAIRQLVTNAIDSQDSIEELQMDVRQRWQTKRGYPGEEHTTDWMILDLSATYFPREDRDNFGSSFAFLQYDWTWNIGDRTSLVSTGWDDPESGGPKMFTIGAFLNRPDRTNFYLGYRQLDPLNSRAVTGAVTYIFSPKYAMSLSTVYDFGTSQALTNSLVFTRVGTDLQISIGASYNAIVNSWGLVLEVVPNISSRTRSRYLTVADPRTLVQ